MAEDRTTQINQWCEIAPRPDLMTGVFREWLRNHFLAADRIEAPELRGRLWRGMLSQPTPGRTNPTTDILIESHTLWNPATQGNRPAVIIRREDWRINRIGIDDRLMGSVNLAGDREYTCIVVGTHTLFCLSTKPAEAEILSGEIYREFLQFGPALRLELDLKQFRVLGVGKLFEVAEARETFAVPVTIGYAADESWRIFPAAPLLKTVKLGVAIP